MATPEGRDRLEAKGLLPGKHLADTGYVDAELLVNGRQQFGVDLVGPTRARHHWQAGAGAGFAAGDFRVDWERPRLTCPREQYESLGAARLREKPAEYKEDYGKRARVEGTISQG
jgi:hypothetical protein